jgi:hypothetical protein
VDLAVEEGAGVSTTAGRKAHAELGHHAGDLVAFHHQVVTACWNSVRFGWFSRRVADRLLVQHAVGLRARGAHRRALARVEDAELDAGLVGGCRHRPAQRIDLLDQMPLADAADRRIAAHRPQRLEVVGQQQRARAHARGASAASVPAWPPPKVRPGIRRRPQGQVVRRRLLPGRLHLRLPDRTGRPRRPLRRVQEASASRSTPCRPTPTSRTRPGTTRPTPSSKIQYPMIGDPTGTITRNFDVMIEEEGLALRGTFVINPEGEIKVCDDRHRPRHRTAAQSGPSTSPATRAKSARRSGRRATRRWRRLPGEDPAADRTRRLARRQRQGAAEMLALLDDIAELSDNAHQLCRHPDGPRVHLAGAGPAADRRPSAQGRARRDRADRRASPATSISRPSSRCPATTARTWCRR